MTFQRSTQWTEKGVAVREPAMEEHDRLGTLAALLDPRRVAVDQDSLAHVLSHRY